MGSAPRVVALVSLLASSLPHVARAQSDDASRSTARDLATAGVGAFQRHAYGDASIKLEKAYRVLRVPSIGLWSARALASAGKLVQASERYREVTRLDATVGDSSVQRAAQADATRELDALTPRMPQVVVRIEGADANDVILEIDGLALSSVLVGESRPVDPGKHHFHGTRGTESINLDVILAEREVRNVVLRFKTAGAVAPAADRAVHAPASAQSLQPATDQTASQSSFGSQRTLALVSGSVGLVGVGLGAYFGLHAKSKLDEANGAGCSDTCPNAVAHSANQDAVSAGKISTIAFAVGAVGLAGGVVLWLTANPSNKPGMQVGLSAAGPSLRAIW